MHTKVLVLNGPNLNMLGVREPEIYGKQSLEDIRRLCEECANSLMMKMDFRQTNHEGELIDWMQNAESEGFSGIILNPAGHGHNSIALLDTVLSIQIPVIEVHLSNIFKREGREHTLTSRAAKGFIGGLGSYGYLLALYALKDVLSKNA